MNLSPKEAAELISGAEETEEIEEEVIEASEEEFDGNDEPEVEAEEAHPEPAIEPPVSWSAEHKEVFVQLPPEMQQTVAQRELQRDSFLTTEATKLAEREKEVEALRSELTEKRDSLLSRLENATPLPRAPSMDLLDENSPKYDPEKYTRDKAKFDLAKAEHDKIVQEAKAERVAEERKLADTWSQEQSQIFQREWPEILGDNGATLANNLIEFAQARGVPREQVIQAGAREILILEDARRWNELQNKSKKTTAKLKTVRKMKPGTGAGKPKAKKSRVERRFEETRDPRAAAALLMEQRGTN